MASSSKRISVTLNISDADERFENLRRQIEVELSWFGEVTVNQGKDGTVFTVPTNQGKQEVEDTLKSALKSFGIFSNIITVREQENEVA